MKKILLIGNGSREHAVAEALKKNRDVSLVVYAKSANPGIQALADAYEIGDLMDLAHVREFAAQQKVDFAFCGPEDPIAAGMADELEKVSIPSCFPKKLPAQLESSKA
ncbi:MAG: phosphoribosylamine--glycine ligase, partial [Bacteroidota bacterium]